MRSITMALDQIWKQQLTLVTYGNEYLKQNLSFNHWVQHAIFNQHNLRFRDLLSQHLLAQHFQVWLEALKKQGTQRISLHSSSLLNDEKNLGICGDFFNHSNMEAALLSSELLGNIKYF